MSVRRLGDYELLRKIGVGGMAEVWMGRRAAMAGASKAVAIKLLARDLLDDPDYRQMFLEEARLSMLLTNSNVVQVFDVGEIDGECFMVMEWVDGLNLSELARKMLGKGEALSTLIAAHVTGEILRALAYAHGLHHDGQKATIVHRDVSPQNVIVSVSGEVKLADFGVARLAREETSGLHVKGKLRYMAPEQLRGRSREPTVDLYAVGAIFHELLENERFRKTRDEGDLYAMVLSGDVPPLTGEVPPELARLHAALLEPDPARRIQSADEALEILYSWPDYRNSSRELGGLVRRWIGVEAPRSGILNSEIIAAANAGTVPGQGAGQGSQGPTREVSTAVASGVATREAEARPVSGPTAASAPLREATVVESGPIADRGATETRTFAAPSAETDSTAVIAGSVAHAGSAGSGAVPSMLIVAAVTLALSFGVFGLGFPLGWWGGDEANAEPRVAERTSDSGAAKLPETTEVVTPPEDETPPTTTTATTSSMEPGGETDTGDDGLITDEGSETGGTTGSDIGGETGEVEVEVEVEEKPKEKPKVVKSPVDRTPAEVRFATGTFNFVWVKVAGKVLPLEPVKEVEIRPGRHRVYFRVSADDSWKSAGVIKIEPGKSYEVKMIKDTESFKLTKL